MTLIDVSIDARDYAPVSISLAVRTIGACFGARHRPDNRFMTGIGLLSVTQDDGGQPHFATAARCLHEGEKVADLLDWLEPRLSDAPAVISWDNWGSVPRRLLALADPLHHPEIVAVARDTENRWRDMPRGHTWHLRQARGQAMPCLCGPDVRIDECDGATPAVLLPNPITTATELIDEAIAGWQSWARPFGDFDDHSHPAQAALRAFDIWRAGQRSAR